MIGPVSSSILPVLLLMLPLTALPASRGVSHGLPAGETTSPGCNVPWSGLEFRATKFIFSASVRITVTTLSSGDALREIVALGGDLEGLLPTGPTVERIHTSATMTTGKTEVADTWIDGATGSVLQTIKEVHGRGNYWKLRRFFADGYHQIREAPMDRKERKRGRERWTKHVETLVRWNTPPPPGGVVTSSYALVYLLSRYGIDREHGERTWFVPVKEDLVEIRLIPGPGRRTKLRIDETWPGGSEILATRLEAPTVRVVPRWLDGRTGEAASNGFMGMRGPAEILLLPGSGIPVRIDGTVKGVGHIASRLVRIHWN